MHKYSIQKGERVNKATLILADGSSYAGRWFGSEPLSCDEVLSQSSRIETLKSFGELVFNTSMTGYHEILTDPSYTGQMVLMTYPHIGNYGTDAQWSENGPQQRNPRQIKAQALIVRDFYEGPLPTSRTSLHSFLQEHDIPALSDIDTRALTLSLRDFGSRNGIIASGEVTAEQVSRIAGMLATSSTMTGKNLIGEVGGDRVSEISTEGSLHFALLDCGIKQNIVRELSKRGVRITLFPSTADYQDLQKSGVDALFISNGPGDPGVLEKQTQLIAEAIGQMPVFGICLGHQLIAQALGAKTYKMKFGHHGANHPVRDELTQKVFVTSQNHGFAVDAETLDKNVRIWFTNANDSSVEGLVHANLPVMSVQFHPEAAPGPHDGTWIFDRFIETAKAYHSS
jgi:carbamoyl-phosphate synthase small subunit